MQKKHWNGRLLAGECVVVFGGLPLLLLFCIPPPWWPWLLALAGIICLIGWLRRTAPARRCWLRPLQTGERALLPLLAARFGLCALLLAALVILFTPERFLSLPREHALAWFALVASYPLFSVLPQEVLYRYLFRLRYRRVFAGGWVLPSTLAFAWLHVALWNWLAPVLSLAAGWFFARTYQVSRSLRLAVAEHALYGALAFSIGLDDFFLHAAITR